MDVLQKAIHKVKKDLTDKYYNKYKLAQLEHPYFNDDLMAFQTYIICNCPDIEFNFCEARMAYNLFTQKFGNYSPENYQSSESFVLH